MPSLSFAGLSGLRGLAPTRRADTRIGTDYTFTRPWQRHTLRLGGGFRRDMSDGRTVSDARGAFVFTGLYTSGGGAVARGSGLDFADFLLGMPQQASVGFGPGDVMLRGLGFNLFAQDDWRARPNLTFNLGVRYEVQRPLHGSQRAHGQSRRGAGVRGRGPRRVRRRRAPTPARSPTRSSTPT